MPKTKKNRRKDPDFEGVFGAQELQIKRVCHACIGEEWISAKIQKTGPKRDCDYCEKTGVPTWPVGALAEKKHETLNRHYAPQTRNPADGAAYLAQKYGTTEWEPEGETVLFVMIELLALDDEPIAEDIRQILSEDVDSIAPGDPQEEARFDEDSYWAYQPIRDDELRWRWQDLETSLRTETRLFNHDVEHFFGEMFNAAARLAEKRGAEFVKTIGPGTDIDTIYRSRVFQSTRDLEEAMKRPDAHLGAPPSRFAKAGRMNPAGIPVFYGATSAPLTFSEIRPPVGSRVFTGEFEILRSLRVLNADALAELDTSGSFFDPDYKGDLAYADFFKTLKSRISRAVLLGDEELDYLPTQAIAEYLARRFDPPFDGILFESAQSNESGRNLVLFSQSCQVETLDCPDHRTEFMVSTTEHNEDGVFPDYRVYASVKSRSPSKTFLGMVFGPEHEKSPPSRATLRLNTNTLRVHHMRSIQVKTDEHTVH